MPKQTFFNLQKSKQDVLIDAAIKEFSRVPLNEAAISNIIATADIPRGSFYQYFENKEDLFFYVFSIFGKKGEKTFVNSLKKNNGDLIETFVQMFEILLTFFRNDEKRSFFKNAFLNINHRVEGACAPSFMKESHNGIVQEFFKLVDMDKLNISDKSEIKHVMLVIKAVTFHNIMLNFANNVSEEEAVEKYKFEMNLLREGIYKK